MEAGTRPAGALSAPDAKGIRRVSPPSRPSSVRTREARDRPCHNRSLVHKIETMKKHRQTRRDHASDLRLGAYLRVSSDDQAVHGLSIDAQRERICAHAKARGYSVVVVEADEAISGRVAPEKRPALSRLLRLIQAGELDGVVFVRFDRLTRSVSDLLHLAKRAEQEGFHLVSVTEQLDTSSATGHFVLTMFGALAEMERRLIAERTRHGMQQVAREGRAGSRFLPFGFRVEGEPDATEVRAGSDRRVVEHEAEMRLLRRMRELRAEGCGAYRIATTLNGEGTPNPRTKRAWSPSTIAAMLRNFDRREALRASRTTP